VPAFIKRYGVSCCIAAMLAAICGGPTPCLSACPDVNADGIWDVLDVQAIASEVLARQADLETRDVNGDGRVDVRDFQAAVTELGESPPASQDPPAERKDSKACLSSVRKPGPAWVTFELVAAGQSVRPVPRYAAWRVSKAAGPSVERFLFHLTPNAPPCPA